MFALLAGLGAGFFHVVAGPDHLAAVAPLAADADRTAWRAGFNWGLGHTAGVLVVGALLLAFRELLPVQALSAWSERLVGLALIVVGVWGAWQARRIHVHRHAHGAAHAHVARAGAGTTALPEVLHGDQHRAPHLHGHAHGGASFGMGLLHGLAGSSHLFGIMPSLAFTSRVDASTYLAGFGVGAIAAMTAFAGFIGVLSAASGRSSAVVHRALLYGTSAAALLVGGFWLLA